MATDLLPLPRTGNLTAVIAAAGKIPELANEEPETILEWCEGMRDDFERKDKLLTVRGLIQAARTLGPGRSGEVVKTIKQLYHKEYVAEKEAAGEPVPATETVSETPTNKVKKKIMTKETSKRENGNGKSAKTEKEAPVKKNGKVPIKVKAKTTPKAPPAKAKAVVKNKPVKASSNGDGGTKQRINNRTQIPVEVVRLESGRAKVTILGHPMRGILRWMGAKKWTEDEGTAALKKMGLTEEAGIIGEKNTLKSVINDHMNSGRKGVQGWHGPWPELSKDEAKALLALKG